MLQDSNGGPVPGPHWTGLFFMFRTNSRSEKRDRGKINQNLFIGNGGPNGNVNPAKFR